MVRARVVVSDGGLQVSVVAVAVFVRTVPIHDEQVDADNDGDHGAAHRHRWSRAVTVPVVENCGTAQAQPGRFSDDDTNVVPSGSVSLTVATAAGPGRRW